MRLLGYDTLKRWSSRSTVVLATTLLYSALTFSHKPEYDFYTEFRNSFTPKLRAENPSLLLTNEEIVDMPRSSRVRESVKPRSPAGPD
jgi:hypothetical protein